MKGKGGGEVLLEEVGERVFELHELDEKTVLGIESRHGHRRFQVEAQPLLYSQPAQLGGALGEVKEEYEIEHDRRGEDGIAAQEIHLDLHGIAEPTEDINVVPTLFVVTTWRIIVNADLVIKILVELRIELGLQDVLQH